MIKLKKTKKNIKPYKFFKPVIRDIRKKILYMKKQ